MKIKGYKILFASCAMLLAASCSVEDIQPINQLTEESVITNEVSANGVLNRIYNHHRNFNLSLHSAATGYYGVEQTAVRGVFQDNGFIENNVMDDSGLLKDFYVSCYAIINEANFFIDRLEAGAAIGLEETKKNEMLAQARFFRAQAHFYLLRVFGEFFNPSSQFGVVVNLAPVRDDQSATARSSVQDTYDAIIADLQFAAQYGQTGVDNFLVSATSAQGLLAKVQLYMGDYANAATSALAVINNADGYALEPVFQDIFTKRWESSEVLFAPFVDGLNEQTAFTESSFAGFVAAPSAIFSTIADESDGALDGVIDNFGKPSTGFDARYSYAYGFFTQGSNGNGKYPYNSFSENADAGNTYYYLRMAEVHLIYAEAEVRRAGGDLSLALGRLNEVRARGGAPAKVLVDAATLLEDIRKEKMLELFTENAESYYDLVRYDQLGELDASAFKSTLTDNKFVLPIPAAALAGNSLLVPNPNQ